MTQRMTIDFERGELIAESGSELLRYPMDSKEAFALLSKAWLRSGWQTKHVYSFTWMGRPIIQLPEDLLRAQEVIYRLKPDVILETGIAHGGSLIFYASLCRAMGHGRVIGLDIEIRPHNRSKIEEHEVADLITMIEGDSIAQEVFLQVQSLIAPGENVFVMLDGKHTKDHVLAELELYSPLVPIGSYIVAADGIMEDLAGLQRVDDDRPNDDWDWNNPRRAAEEFVAKHDDFAIESPAFVFNEGVISEPVTYWPDSWIKRVR